MVDPRELERHRGRIWGLCYRMTGVAADADELVQETFMRALETPPSDLARDLLPWLIRVATNASRDLLRRRKTQAYVGDWLPAPVEDERLLAEPSDALTPDARYGQAESVSYAFMVALEALTPTQRAVVILRDVLGYSVSESALVLGMSEANVKTSHHRARSALAGYDQRVQRAPVPLERAREAMMRFMGLVMAGDLAEMERLLAKDVVAVGDSAGEFLAQRRPVLGANAVARFFLGVSRKSEIASVELRTCNGLPALVLHTKNRLARAAERSVTMFEVADNGEILRVYSVLATRKLAHFVDQGPRAAG